MSSNNNRNFGNAPLLHIIISTGFGIGVIVPGKFGPGTVGAFAGLLIWIGLYLVLTPKMLLVATLLLIISSLLIGVWTDNVMEKYLGPDPNVVIVDEFFGTWVAVTAVLFYDGPASHAVALAFLSFALFRFIDITKPLGCRWVDTRVHGGWGCMLDDALAGFYACILTLIVRQICF